MSEPRRAVPNDAEGLTALRAEMFRSMGMAVSDPAWMEGCTRHFRRALAEPNMAGFVIDAPDGSGLAASGVVEFEQRIPSPGNAEGWFAYISSMSTWAKWRRQGYARAIFAMLLDAAEARGVQRVELHATQDGIELYRTFGFSERGGGVEMRLRRD